MLHFMILCFFIIIIIISSFGIYGAAVFPDSGVGNASHSLSMNSCPTGQHHPGCTQLYHFSHMRTTSSPAPHDPWCPEPPIARWSWRTKRHAARARTTQDAEREEQPRSRQHPVPGEAQPRKSHPPVHRQFLLMFQSRQCLWNFTKPLFLFCSHLWISVSLCLLASCCWLAASGAYGIGDWYVCRYFSCSFSLILTKLGTHDLCARMQKTEEQKFRIFDFKILANFLKILSI